MKKVTFLVVFALFIFSFASKVEARQGCCSWHGGVCGCGCCDGTPLSATCAPYYSCSAPVIYRPLATPTPDCIVPNLSTTKSSTNFVENRNNCTQNINFDWDDVVFANGYSLGISKTPGVDPGNIADTAVSEYAFNQINPGTWYINIKARNNCGWSRIFYWKTEVPTVNPQISVTEEIINEKERKLIISSSCAKKITASPNIGSIPVSKESVVVKPTASTFYTFTATNGKAISTDTVYVEYPLPTATPTHTPIPTSTPIIISTDTSKPLVALGLPLGILGVAVYFGLKNKS